MAVKADKLAAFAENGCLTETEHRLFFGGAGPGRKRGRSETLSDYYGARAGDVHEFYTSRFVPGNRKEYKKYSNNGDKEVFRVG